MHITGRCHCGNIKYQAEVDPNAVGLCHCTDCQILSGSPFRSSVSVKKEDFKLTGQPKIYVKTAESGNKRAQAFCPECGTHVYAAAPVDPQVFNIRTGTIDQRSQLRPKRQIWCKSAQPWVMDLKAIEQIAGQPG